MSLTPRGEPKDGPIVQRLRCEHLSSPVVTDRSRPRLSWQVSSPRRGASQAAYQVVVGLSPDLSGGGDVWDSGRVESAECLLIPYAGRELRSREQFFWSVRAWDDLGQVSPFAPSATWEMGLLEESDWSASWIGADCQPSEVSHLRSVLHVASPVLRARAYITALGLYELHCNGQRVGDARFSPGWTDYRQRLQYQVLDLTDLLVPGDNELTALLADGWYAGYIGFQGARGHYGDTPQLLAQLEVQTADGLVVHSTGADWLVGGGPVLRSDMLQGEHQDLRVAPGQWAPVRLTEGTAAPRVVSPSPPVRVLRELPPISVERVGAETHVIDLGQNLVGWLRLRLDADPGTTVTVRHAEILQPDGSLYLDNLRTAGATDSYVLARPGWCEPHFTFHGFRYAEVTGHPGDLTIDDIVGVVCGSDLEEVGAFACSNAAVNQLHANIVWGARGNFFDVPTDCPQRDERMGWTGDAQVFAPTATRLFDTAGFFTKWLRDLRDGQRADGSFPDVAPVVVLGSEGSAGWADAGVIVPWVMWERYADRDVLAECYTSMRAWVDYVHRANPALLWTAARGYDNGDWLSIGADTDKTLIATACFARSARLTARAAEVVRPTEAAELHELADGIRDAFCGAFLLPDGRLRHESQTAYALALRFGLVPADLAANAAARLLADVRERGTHLTTGFLGVAELLPALTEAGHHDAAYGLLLQDTFPSWLYAVQAGATTIWERWDGWTEESGYGDPAMNSYNHYALGSVGEWLYWTVAGIGYSAPGGRRLALAPVPHAALDWAGATLESPFGRVRSHWERSADGSLTIDFEVPVGATAAVVLPGGDNVLEAGLSLDLVAGLTLTDRTADALHVELGSGSYSFTIPTQPHHREQPTKGSAHAR